MLSRLMMVALVLVACNARKPHGVQVDDEPEPGADGGTPPPGADAGVCTPMTSCGQKFTYPFGSETTVELHGDFNGWGPAVPMKHVGADWVAEVPSLGDGSDVVYKFVADGKWVTDPRNPRTVPDGLGGDNSVLTVSCDTCMTAMTPPGAPAPFDWRDAVIYFVFVDRFVNGSMANDCSGPRADATSTTSAGYLGGDWAGVKQKIDDGYFNRLGVNTLWLTVPLKNADSVVERGTNGDSHLYSAYHGYWPLDPNQVEGCFGTLDELKGLVQAAHAHQLKVLFDYAMVHVHTSSALYQQHKSDGWFTQSCICGEPGCAWDQRCWFAPYLAHLDFTNAQAREMSVNAAVWLAEQTGVDAYRLDAIKQVDPSWLQALRPRLPSFYMVGETYEFQDRAQIKSMVAPGTKLDGQFDFPLRLRLVEALLMRSTQNQLTPDDKSWSRNARPGLAGLKDFMDSNDGFYGPGAVMSTFIGNHDLPRSIHFAEDAPMFQDPATDGKANAWSNAPGTSSNPRAYERLANAFAVLFTNPGAPLVYYGDEIGLAGAGDPDNRRMMPWSGHSAAQLALRHRLEALAALRAAHPALRRGTRRTLSVDSDLWVYAMSSGSDTVYVAINRSDSDRPLGVSLPSGVTELLTKTPLNGSVAVPARQTRIFN